MTLPEAALHTVFGLLSHILHFLDPARMQDIPERAAARPVEPRWDPGGSQRHDDPVELVLIS